MDGVQILNTLTGAADGRTLYVADAPDGRVDRIVPMPAGQPGSCAFGGPDLGTPYVTSACVGLTHEVRQAQPKAGGLFAFYPGVPGLPLPAFEGWRGRPGTAIMPRMPDARGPE